MRLRELKAHRWLIYGVVGDDDSVAVVDDLIAIRDGNLRAAAAGFVALIDRCAEFGPHALPDTLSHDVGSGIREFIKGRYRLLYFVVGGAVVVCTHTFMKKSDKTPNREVSRAVRVKDAYEAAAAAGELEYVRSDDDVLLKVR